MDPVETTNPSECKVTLTMNDEVRIQSLRDELVPLLRRIGINTKENRLLQMNASRVFVILKPHFNPEKSLKNSIMEAYPDVTPNDWRRYYSPMVRSFLKNIYK
jgi:hypothetical protein